jgi:large subunit ribosomal protein L17
MRHKKEFNHLSRKPQHRKAMLSNMASSLILHKRIKTTTAKAKALRMYVEPLITKSKDDSTHMRRVVFGYLQNKDAVSELFRDVSPKVINRPGGYTRILKTGNRLGDNADMCIIELVDYNENLLEAQKSTKAKSGTRRRRRGGGGTKVQAAEADKVAVETTGQMAEPQEREQSQAETQEKQSAEAGKKQEQNTEANIEQPQEQSTEVKAEQKQHSKSSESTSGDAEQPAGDKKNDSEESSEEKKEG